MNRGQGHARGRILRDGAVVVPVGLRRVRQLVDLAVLVVVKETVAGGASQQLDGQAGVFVDGLDVGRLGDDILALLDVVAGLGIALVEAVDDVAGLGVPEDGGL